MRKSLFIFLTLFALLTLVGCSPAPSSSDKMRDQQEKTLQDAVNAVGTPSIKNHREMRLVKDLYELRDQNGLVTFTYVKSEIDNKICFYGETVGFGIPYATQYSAPESMQRYFLESTGNGDERHYGAEKLPQSEPNGLYTPSSAEGTWVMLKNPEGNDVKPEYIESRIIVSQYKRKNVPSCWP